MPVYLDNNASTPLKPEVRDAMVAALDLYGNPSSTHSFGQGGRMAIDHARRHVAQLFHVRPEQVVFTAGGTEANNLVMRGVMAGQVGKKMLISAVEHSSVRATAAALEKAGVVVDRVGVDKHGVLDLADLKSMLQQGNVALVCVLHANNETGAIQPVRDIADLCKAHGAMFMVDAVQTAGKTDIDPATLGADFVTVSFHKMGGPKGAGAVIFAGAPEMQAHTTGGSQERYRRAGTENIAAIVGAGVAAELAPKAIAKQEEIARLRQKMEQGLKRLANDLIIVGENTPRMANTTNVLVPGVDGQTMLMALDLEGYAVATGSACFSGRVEPSPVILAHGYAPELAKCAVRISLGVQNTEAEVDGFVDAFKRVLDRLRT